jgi:uncharacterized membrane protein (DUF373 family)
MRLRQEVQDARAQWQTLSLYEKFEQGIISIITLLIAAIVAVATWQLVLHVAVLVGSHLLIPVNFEVFQSVFGMIFTVLIALEFRHSMLVVVHGRASAVHVGSVVLIAILALVRKFIILDIHSTDPGLVAALASAVLALGVVYWLIRGQDRREERQEVIGSSRQPS